MTSSPLFGVPDGVVEHVDQRRDELAPIPAHHELAVDVELDPHAPVLGRRADQVVGLVHQVRAP